MSAWQREAARLVLPDGTPWVHPRTVVERVAGGYRLTAHKVANFSIIVPDGHALAGCAL